MNLTKLFETQAALDEHIMQEHPELRGQNNLDWKLLALQVELGECANEWRGFKKWSKDQEPRTKAESICGCIMCGHHSIPNKKNPLLEEYVDCLHLILSIGVEKRYTDVHINHDTVLRLNMRKDPLEDFRTMFGFIYNFEQNPKRHWYDSVFEGFINLGIGLGFTWDEVETAYYEKNKVNHERQESGY